MNEIDLLTYKEVLEHIRDQENHLLLGNGFNRGLGINTSYSNIFKKMMEKDHGLYRDAESLVKNCNYDLEKFIGDLINDVDTKNAFLRKYISNKVKLDFMQTTHEIVKSSIKNIYAEESEGVFLLLKNFSNYFTLNYDPLLYLLLLNFKLNKNLEKTSIVFQPSLKFMEEDLDKSGSNIYTEIKHARENGTLVISGVDGDNSTSSSFSKLTKSHFTTEITEYSKRENKGWKSNDIKRVIDALLEEEKKNYVLEKVDDGSRETSLFSDETKYVFDTTSTTQNIFFLHGAFHIYKEGHQEIKITQQSNKALYERLEDVLNSEERDIVCVFQSKNKTDAIDQSDYLKNCFRKLKNISGKMVIIGCSMDDNDSHIFEQINNSNIDALYISTFGSDKDEMYIKAKAKFPSKSFLLFDANTISYEMPEENEE